MKATHLLALFWCVSSQALYASQNGPWLKFSGNTEMTKDGRHGALGVAADRLLSQSDAIGFNYHDARSYRNETDSSGASFHYRLPAGSNRLRIEAGQSRYDHAVTSGEHRFNASGESRVLGLGASRPLFSRFGLAFDGIARHRGLDSEAFEQDSLVSEFRYQLSSFGLEANGGRELGSGALVNTRVLALSGREFAATDYPLHDNLSDERAFYKVAVSASIEQELFHWNWRANGRYQFADEDLPTSEYITIAGPSMLTGFNGQSVAVVQGGWLRLDSASPDWPLPFLDGVVSSVNFSLLQGWIPDSGPQAWGHGNASAGQVTLQMQGRAFTANVCVGRMIRASTLALTMPEHPDIRFTLFMGI